MNLSPETAEILNSTMNCLQNENKSVTLGLMDIIDLWPFGKTYLATTTAEEVFIQFKGFRQSKVVILNLKNALSGLVENTTIQSAVIKCNHEDINQEMPQPLHEISLTADINSQYDVIIQLLNEIEAIPDKNLQYFESKIQSNDLKNKIFSGYIEYATKTENEERATIHHRSFLLD